MPNDLYSNPSRPKKPSSAWKLKHPTAQPIRPMPKPPAFVYEDVKREGTLNKHAQDLLRRSRKYGQ